MQAICEECGLPKSEWKAADGKGYERGGVRYCCQGCFLGIGCTCKETGVRRVVVVPTPESQAAQLRKTGRTVKKWESKVAALERRAAARKTTGEPAGTLPSQRRPSPTRNASRPSAPASR